VTGISWDDAIIYCAWLSSGSEYTYRLPTEAEWEKGARWGPRFRHARTYTWEGDWTDTNCNVPHQLEVIGAHPQAASAYGVQDMLGKIWQWTISKWRLYPLTTSALASDVRHIVSHPPGASALSRSADERRVVRGGSYAEARRAYKRATIRQGFAPDYRADDLGFRLVRTKSGG